MKRHAGVIIAAAFAAAVAGCRICGTSIGDSGAEDGKEIETCIYHYWPSIDHDLQTEMDAGACLVKEH